jgi:hypothetical protein
VRPQLSHAGPTGQRLVSSRLTMPVSSSRAGAVMRLRGRPRWHRLPMLTPWPDRWTGPLRQPGRPVAPDHVTPDEPNAGPLSWPTVHRPAMPERVTTPRVGLSQGRNPDQAALKSARSPGRWPDPRGGTGKAPDHRPTEKRLRPWRRYPAGRSRRPARGWRGWLPRRGNTRSHPHDRGRHADTGKG